jgi:hypothetical protein
VRNSRALSAYLRRAISINPSIDFSDDFMQPLLQRRCVSTLVTLR